jgi:hypothetical protein
LIKNGYVIGTSFYFVKGFSFCLVRNRLMRTKPLLIVAASLIAIFVAFTVVVLWIDQKPPTIPILAFMITIILIIIVLMIVTVIRKNHLT